MAFLDRLAHAWNAFQDDRQYGPFGPPTGLSQGLVHQTRNSSFSVPNDTTIVPTILNKIAVDVSSIEFMHVRKDEYDRFDEVIDSGLNRCLNDETNLDQGPRSFKLDLVSTIMQEGVAAVVPVDTTLNPNKSGGYDIKSMRVGTITSWHPQHVEVSLYNEKTGTREQILLDKRVVAIIQNPFYTIMNEQNSTLQRLVRKLTLLDRLDNNLVDKKLDLIIQLPYTIKSESKRLQAEQRRRDIEFQLASSTYGIAYTDAAESVTQLNRPVDNNLLATIEYLTKQLHSQLGISEEVLNGTADEREMLNYFTRTVEPIADAIAEEMNRVFLTQTARTQRQMIMYLRRPFRLVPMSDLADIGDKLTRNQILTPNEVRSMVGFMPSDDPTADELRNPNMPREDTDLPEEEVYSDSQNEDEY